MHNFFKAKLSFLVTDTIDGPDASSKCIRVRLKSGGRKSSGTNSRKRKERGDKPFDSRGSNNWPEHRGKFLRYWFEVACHFNLCKLNTLALLVWFPTIIVLVKKAVFCIVGIVTLYFITCIEPMDEENDDSCVQALKRINYLLALNSSSLCTIT